jgi:hypothetical protein
MHRKDNSYTGEALKSIIVLGVPDNLKNRKMFEDVFVDQFE